MRALEAALAQGALEAERGRKGEERGTGREKDGESFTFPVRDTSG